MGRRHGRKPTRERLLPSLRFLEERAPACRAAALPMRQSRHAWWPFVVLRGPSWIAVFSFDSGAVSCDHSSINDHKSKFYNHLFLDRHDPLEVRLTVSLGRCYISDTCRARPKHTDPLDDKVCLGGEIGRRKGLKILRRFSSIPVRLRSRAPIVQLHSRRVASPHFSPGGVIMAQAFSPQRVLGSEERSRHYGRASMDALRGKGPARACPAPSVMRTPLTLSRSRC